jgi:hypothetical protein
MERKPNVIHPVVIRQDDATELRIHAAILSGRRQLDIRVWKRGPTGFTPTRNALTLEPRDVSALHDGIDDLLEASNGGRQVARIVVDTAEGRRLRAETAPFGTRHLAKMGFWQRVRDTWRPADDSLVVNADRLPEIRDVLAGARTRLLRTPESATDGAVVLQPAALQRWPAPGADWITIEPDRLAFHPRGLRITATVEEEGERHQLVLHPWRRHESLWLPGDSALPLRVPELDTLLTFLRELADGKATGSEREIPCMDSDVLTVRREEDPDDPTLVMERSGDEGVAHRLALSLEQLPRFGRMLAQCGMLLITSLTDEELEELHHREGPEIAPEIVAEAIPPPRPDPDLAEEVNAAEADADDQANGIDTEQGEEAGAPLRRFTPMGEVQLGRQTIFLYLVEEQHRHLSLQWDGRSLMIPVEHVSELLEDLRQLYYEALRGRRGHVSTVGGEPAVHMSVHNQGSTLAVVLEHEIDGRQTRLAFPVNQVPTFLNTATAVMRRLQPA